MQTLRLQSFHQFRFPVIPICQSKDIHTLQLFFSALDVMKLGRCPGAIDYRAYDRDSRQANLVAGKSLPSITKAPNKLPHLKPG